MNREGVVMLSERGHFRLDVEDGGLTDFTDVDSLFNFTFVSN